MAKLPLSQTVDSARSEKSWRSSILPLLTSTLVQGVAIVTLIVTPLLVAQAMPEPANQLTLPPFVPARVEPPIQPVQHAPQSSAEARAPKETSKPRFDVTTFVPPIDIPDGIPERDDYFVDGDPMGVPGGIPVSLAVGLPQPLESAPPPEADPEPILIVGNVRPPRKVVHVDPVYPRIAMQAHVQGTVELQAVIDSEGRVSNLTVVASVPLLDRAAIEAVQQWRYEPTLQNGRPVPVIMTVEVEFVLRR